MTLKLTESESEKPVMENTYNHKMLKAEYNTIKSKAFLFVMLISSNGTFYYFA